MVVGGLRARFRPGLGTAELGIEWRRQRARRGRLWCEGFERGGEEMAGAMSFARVGSTCAEEGEGKGWDGTGRFQGPRTDKDNVRGERGSPARRRVESPATTRGRGMGMRTTSLENTVTEWNSFEMILIKV